MGKDYYKILGVDKGANQEDIKKAFRKKAHEYHPDKAHGDEAKFKEINEAYQVLGNAKKRGQYDQFGPNFEQAQGAGGFGGFRDASDYAQSGGFNVNMDDLGDIFGGIGDIFGFGGGGGGRTRSRRGADIQVILTIDFNDAVFGAEKEVNLQKKVKCDKCNGNGAEPGTKIETCPTCHGSGRVARVQRTVFGNVQVQAVCETCQGEGKTYAQKCTKCHGQGAVQDNVRFTVKIPAGIDNGETIRLTGQGEAGDKGATAGDLYLKIKVTPDKRFVRDGYDIRTEARVSFTQAALGDKIEVETIDGAVKLKVPAGTQSGTTFKLRGKGVSRLQGSGRGDQYVKVLVVTPTSLSRKQKELLRGLEE